MTERENLEFPLRRHKHKFGEITYSTQIIEEALKNVWLFAP